MSKDFIRGLVVGMGQSTSTGTVVADRELVTKVTNVRVMIPAVLTTGAVIASDNFDRADVANGIGSLVTGQPWIAQKGGWGIQGNAAYISVDGGNNQQLVFESGVSDGVIEMTCGVKGTSQGILFRSTDANNGLCVRANYSNMEIYKIIAGTWILLTTRATITWVAGDVMKVAFCGNQIQMFIKGLKVLEILCDDFTTVTRHGLRSDNTASKYDNFLMSAVTLTSSMTIVPL